MNTAKLTSAGVLDQLELQIVERMKTLNQMMIDLQSDIASDDKSTAGDKHETSRAMIHLEQERLSEQIHEVDLQLAQIKNLRHIRPSKTIAAGSLVFTSDHIYYVGIGAGKVLVDSHLVLAVSVQSPIGHILLGRIVGDEIFFGNKRISITEVN